MEVLFLIPARAGSKGLPGKNVKLLNGKPLVQYSIEAAMGIADNSNICISTDSDEVIAISEGIGLSVPFKRPALFASDSASSEDVIKHALDFYAKQGRTFDFVVMLQPTSPLRTSDHIKSALELVDKHTELLVSVKETDANPYYVLFEEGNSGILEKTKEGVFTRRQDCPVVYQLNGAIYVINVEKLLAKGYQQLKMTKFLMSKEASVDIDDEIDFTLAGILLNK